MHIDSQSLWIAAGLVGQALFGAHFSYSGSTARLAGKASYPARSGT